MARSALQVTMRDLKAKKGSLKDEIENLATKGLLPPIMRDWADELRTLGNESAHPKPDSVPADSDDANDIIEYLNFLLKYLYDLPLQIKEYRKRKSNNKITS